MAGMLSTNSTPASTSAASSTTSTSTTSSSSPQQPLYIKYPISSQWEFKLNNGETVQGEIYCTDQVADLIILQDSTNNDIRMISVTSIITGETQQITENNNGSDIEEDDAIEKAATVTATTKKVDIVHSKKVLDEREKRAIRLAQESLKHLNPKVRTTIYTCVRRVFIIIIWTTQ